MFCGEIEEMVTYCKCGTIYVRGGENIKIVKDLKSKVWTQVWLAKRIGHFSWILNETRKTWGSQYKWYRIWVHLIWMLRGQIICVDYTIELFVGWATAFCQATPCQTGHRSSCQPTPHASRYNTSYIMRK